MWTGLNLSNHRVFCTILTSNVYVVGCCFSIIHVLYIHKFNTNLNTIRNHKKHNESILSSWTFKHSSEWRSSWYGSCWSCTQAHGPMGDKVPEVNSGTVVINKIKLQIKLVEHNKSGLIFYFGLPFRQRNATCKLAATKDYYIVARMFLKIIFRGCPIIHSLSNRAMLERVVNAILWCNS